MRLCGREQSRALCVVHPSGVRPHREFWTLAPDALLELFFKRYEGHVGPGASVYLGGRERVRFDCLGANGHLHRLQPGHRPEAFPSAAIPAQIAAAARALDGGLVGLLPPGSLTATPAQLRTAAALLEARLLALSRVMPRRCAGAPLPSRAQMRQATRQARDRWRRAGALRRAATRARAHGLRGSLGLGLRGWIGRGR